MSVMSRLIVLAILCAGVLGTVACVNRGVEEEASPPEPVAEAPLQEAAVPTEPDLVVVEESSPPSEPGETVISAPEIEQPADVAQVPAIACPTDAEIDWVLATEPIYASLGNTLTRLHEATNRRSEEPTLRLSREWKAMMLGGSLALVILAEDLLELPLAPTAQTQKMEHTQIRLANAIDRYAEIIIEAVDTGDLGTYAEGLEALAVVVNLSTQVLEEAFVFTELVVQCEGASQSDRQS